MNGTVSGVHTRNERRVRELVAQIDTFTEALSITHAPRWAEQDDFERGWEQARWGATRELIGILCAIARTSALGLDYEWARECGVEQDVLELVTHTIKGKGQVTLTADQLVGIREDAYQLAEELLADEAWEAELWHATIAYDSIDQAIDSYVARAEWANPAKHEEYAPAPPFWSDYYEAQYADPEEHAALGVGEYEADIEYGAELFSNAAEEAEHAKYDDSVGTAARDAYDAYLAERGAKIVNVIFPDEYAGELPTEAEIDALMMGDSYDDVYTSEIPHAEESLGMAFADVAQALINAGAGVITLPTPEQVQAGAFVDLKGSTPIGY